MGTTSRMIVAIARWRAGEGKRADEGERLDDGDEGEDAAGAAMLPEKMTPIVAWVTCLVIPWFRTDWLNENIYSI